MKGLLRRYAVCIRAYSIMMLALLCVVRIDGPVNEKLWTATTMMLAIIAVLPDIYDKIRMDEMTDDIRYKVGAVVNQRTGARGVTAYSRKTGLPVATYLGYENYKTKTITLYPVRLLNSSPDLIFRRHVVHERVCE